MKHVYTLFCFSIDISSTSLLSTNNAFLVPLPGMNSNCYGVISCNVLPLIMLLIIRIKLETQIIKCLSRLVLPLTFGSVVNICVSFTWKTSIDVDHVRKLCEYLSSLFSNSYKHLSYNIIRFCGFIHGHPSHMPILLPVSLLVIFL